MDTEDGQLFIKVSMPQTLLSNLLFRADRNFHRISHTLSALTRRRSRMHFNYNDEAPRMASLPSRAAALPLRQPKARPPQPLPPSLRRSPCHI